MIGLLLKRGFSEELRELLLQANGLCVLILGLRMALAAPNDVIVIIGLTLGGIIGYTLHLYWQADRVAVHLKRLVRVQDPGFVEGFVTSSLVFCVGAVWIVGALEAELNHQFDVLYVKSTVDGIIAVVLASTMGIGVVFSGLAVMVYQGALTLLAGALGPVLTDVVVDYLSAGGGVLIAAIGLGIAGIKEIKTINLLPGIFIAAAIGYFFG